MSLPSIKKTALLAAPAGLPIHRIIPNIIDDFQNIPPSLLKCRGYPIHSVICYSIGYQKCKNIIANWVLCWRCLYPKVAGQTRLLLFGPKMKTKKNEDACFFWSRWWSAHMDVITLLCQLMNSTTRSTWSAVTLRQNFAKNVTYLLLLHLNLSYLKIIVITTSK